VGYQFLVADKFRLQLEELPNLVNAVQSNNAAAQLEATIQFRKLLSIGNCEKLNQKLAQI
jgi:hypothetical protein